MDGPLFGRKTAVPDSGDVSRIVNGSKVGKKARVCVTVVCVEELEGGYEFAFEETPDDHIIWEEFGSQSITWLG